MNQGLNEMNRAVTEKKLRCIAVDDEPFALRLIADDIAQVPFLNLVSTFGDSAEALRFIQKNPVDLIFLDIEMPGMTGTQFVRSLTKPPMVVFTTAYEQYAVEGFELDVVDYLLKPIPFERFLRASTRCYEQLHQDPLEALKNSFFFVFSEYKEIKILNSDVLYIEGLKDYVKIFLTTRTHPILTRMNLKAIELKLDPRLFCRIHNSFIVSLSKIESFQKAQVFVGKKAIPVGDKYAEVFARKYRSTQ